jgi:NADH-quinone oxidoreductase subunit L
VMAVIAGFVGVNAEFPVVAPLVKSLVGVDTPFGDFVGRTLIEPPHHLPFNWLPVIISLSVFAIGTLIGWALYGRREYNPAQPDPLENVLGSDIYRILQQKYYMDELYEGALVKPFYWFAERFTNVILDKGIIDGTLHAIAGGAVWVGNLLREFNRVVIDGVGDGIPEALAALARTLRQLQTGHVQQYLLYTLAGALWLGVNLIVLAVLPNVIGAFVLAQAAAVLAILLYFNLSSRQARS